MNDLAFVKNLHSNNEVGFVENIHAGLVKAEIAIDWATRMGDVQQLEAWVNEKIRLQQQVVAWWDRHVRKPGKPQIIADTAIISAPEGETCIGFSPQQVSRWRTTSVKDPDKCRERQILAALRKAGIEPPANHRALSTGEFEWYTPARYVDLARAVMGGIDLDPASNAVAQTWIKAGVYFTPTEDGLAQDWHGRVWLNPPYAQPEIMHFIDKLVAERQARRVDQAILLTHNYTDTTWFHTAYRAADVVCLTRGRIQFVDEDGTHGQPTQGQAFFYFGDHREAFAAAFDEVGLVTILFSRR
jgi:phage N-6-adenine-methyltransferase